MPPYDSDSSGDEDSEFTETNVLLGYASKEPTDDNFSQLGGHPTWLDTTTTPSFALTKCGVCNTPMPLLLQINGDAPTHFPGHSRRLYIFACRRKPCARKAGSVRAVRGVKVDAALAAAERKKNEEEAAKAEQRRKEEEERWKKQGQLGTALFGGGAGPTPAQANPFAANPFAASGGGAGGAMANPFASPASGLAAKPPQAVVGGKKEDELSQTFAEKARIAAAAPATSDQPAAAAAAARPPYEPWPTDASALAKPYPSYHLDADYETLSPEDNSLPANAQLDPNAADPDDAAGEGSGSGAGAASKEDKQIYESLMDKTFQRFADRLAQNPEQVLRYEWNGLPLLYSKTDAVGKLLDSGDDDDNEDMEEGKVKTAGGRGKGMPKCANCGAGRVFEVQLTPQAIAELEAEELGLDGMEWGTIIVGVCSKDCVTKDAKDGEAEYLEEWVGVQWEEVADRK
ncbi:Pdcd2-c domain-containing protein [Lasiodiplodia theobromae]|uniref:Pdcd2-c domain-containing protein n=1 Tax=Lasiodiplodia theobromae TaxID=45133 RepID=UPI0015C3077F|nr:Pdcd2-c domain-containing protein [Lasiodiplodia theobromae]KAF4545541.1 Pdcd2-c domain-containing protein [Lasiodiplodia theobromae]